MAQVIEKAVLETILSKNTEIFLNEIQRLFEYRKYPIPGGSLLFDFEILLPTDSAFFTSAKRKNLTTFAIRDKLINPTLADLFKAHWNIDVTVDYSHLSYQPSHGSYSFIERIYPFEFIVPINNNRIGYRYTDVYWTDEQFETFSNEYNLSYIYIIDWTTEGLDFFDAKYPSDFSYADKVKYIPLGQLFSTYFSSDEYDICMNSFRSAIKKAWEYQDYSTVPELSPRYLYDFKHSIDDFLLLKRIDSLQYKYLDNNGRTRNISQLLTPQIIHSIQSVCFDNGLYKCLYGKSDFAKCFITAEYLYSIFQNGNNHIECTSVVCGYIKCIEQFLHFIVKTMLNSGLYNQSYILLKGSSSPQERNNGTVIPNPHFENRAGATNRSSQNLIRFLPIYESRFNISIVSMVNFLAENDRAWIMPEGKIEICKLMRNYAKNCRNDYFHKDNIKDFSIVNAIRNNTICILLLLLGNIKIPVSEESVKELLNIYDNSFDLFLRKMKEFFPHDTDFILQYGDKRINAYRIVNQPFLDYDCEFGTLENNSIRFFEVDNFDGIPFPNDKHYEDWAQKQKEFIVTKNNIPDKVIYLRLGKQYDVIW